MMVEAASVYEGQYELVLAAAPNIDPEFYGKVLRGSRVKILYGQTYRILHHACAALVTSGTATLETAFSGCPKWCVIIRPVANWFLSYVGIS